jgi:hypothetical protein
MRLILQRTLLEDGVAAPRPRSRQMRLGQVTVALSSRARSDALGWLMVAPV